jgi:hypothetical protein
MKINCIVALFALLLAGCQTTGTSKGVAQALVGGPAASASGGQAAMRNETAALTYFDSSSFDIGVSDAMSKEVGTVNVTVAAPFNLNKIPQRMDKWLAAVKGGGGNVAARQETAVATRSLGGVAMDVAVALYDHVSERMQYAPAANYDATLYYRTGGDVDRVLFTRK